MWSGDTLSLNCRSKQAMAISLLISGSLVLATGGLFHLLENQRPIEEIDRTKSELVPHLSIEFSRFLSIVFN